MRIIEKLKIFNFKRFDFFDITFDKTKNVFIGDNESGKSTLLTAIDLVLSGSRNKIETLGLDRLFNITAVQNFLDSDKKIENLPELKIELYFNNLKDPSLNGNWNTDGKICDGLRLVCEPRVEFSAEIKEVLEQDGNFPFEYYSLTFQTFSGESYSGYRKFLNHILLDNTLINNEYATKKYISTLYSSNVNDSEKSKHKNEYRRHKEEYRKSSLQELNDRLTDYSFAIRTNSRSNLETDLTIVENDIDIENKGKGKQCFIKTQFALQKSKNPLNVVLLEEPENHLSHTKVKELIHSIDNSQSKQLFIATHSTTISTRLDLRNAILLNSNSTDALLLNNIKEDTAKFFIKAPDNNILEFILSQKVILVEGDAEFILMEAIYEKIAGRKIAEDNVHIIFVGGTSFPRYLELAEILKITTAVITDNDGDFNQKITERYDGYLNEKRAVFADEENARSTFEICIYNDNKDLCDTLFTTPQRKLPIQQYMLNNKSEASFKLLENSVDGLKVPQYIINAIEWINK